MQYRFNSPQRPNLLILAFLTVGFIFTGDAFSKSQKGWLGVSIREMTPSLRQDYDLGSRSGLLITQVVSNSPADDAGLREDDVILKYNGKSVELSDEFSKMVRQTEPKTAVKISIMRDGKEKKIEVAIGKIRRRPSNFFAFGEGDFTVMMGRPQLGVRVHELNEDLAPYFKVKENGGVLISEVFEDTPADDAGLKAGDVITLVDGEKISDPEELIETLEDYEDEDVVKITYVRAGKQAQVEVELEAHENDFRFHTNFAPGIDLRRLGDRHEIRRAPRIQIRGLLDQHNSI